MLRRFGWVLGVGLALTACDSWLGADNHTRLKGTRISILSHERSLKPETSLAGTIALPKPKLNKSWPQAGGFPRHSLQHLALSATIKKAWSVDIGTGAGSREHLLGAPVVAGERVYTIDAKATVTAFKAIDGQKIWSVSVLPDDLESASLEGGGIAYDKGRVYATTGFGQVVALDAANGNEVWRRSVGAPVRSAPTISGSRIFVINKENELHTLAVADGHELWVHAGIVEPASLLGGPSPAVDAAVVVTTYSSGEVFALRVENGSVLWSDVLGPTKRTDSVSDLADIVGHPVIDHGRVYVVGHSGLLVAIDMRSGERVWEINVGGTHQPWLAGDFLYMLGNENELIAVATKTGQVVWVTPFQSWENEETHKGRIIWSGPILAGDRLVVVGSHGKAAAVSPYTGKIMGEVPLPSAISISPIVANDTLYFLTDNADLVAFR